MCSFFINFAVQRGSADTAKISKPTDIEKFATDAGTIFNEQKKVR